MKKYWNKFFQQAGINKHNTELLLRWINGETGIDFIDANMIELKPTGFMSNRGRQNVASYLCRDLKLLFEKRSQEKNLTHDFMQIERMATIHPSSSVLQVVNSLLKQ